MAFFVLATGLLAGTAIAMAESDHYCQHHPYDCDCCEEDAAYFCYGKLQVEVLEARNILDKGKSPSSKHKYYVEVLKSKDGRYYTSYDRTSSVKGTSDVSFVHGECKHSIHHHLGYFLLLKRTISAKSGPPTVILLLKKKGYWNDKVVGGAVIELQQSPHTTTPVPANQPTSSTQKTAFQTVQTTPGSQEVPGFGFDMTRDFDRRITVPLHSMKHGHLRDPIPTNLDVVLHYRPINIEAPIQAQVPVYIPQTVIV